MGVSVVVVSCCSVLLPPKYAAGLFVTVFNQRRTFAREHHSSRGLGGWATPVGVAGVATCLVGRDHHHLRGQPMSEVTTISFATLSSGLQVRCTVHGP